MKKIAAARLKRLFQKRVQLQMRVPMQARIKPYTTCRGPEQILYTRLPEGMAMPLQTAKPTMAPMLSNPAAAISMDGMTACPHEHVIYLQKIEPSGTMPVMKDHFRGTANGDCLIELWKVCTCTWRWQYEIPT